MLRVLLRMKKKQNPRIPGLVSLPTRLTPVPADPRGSLASFFGFIPR